MEQPNEKILKKTSDKFHVNEVSAFFGFTPRILKHYETTGVLEPNRDERNGYREYTAEDVIKIQTAAQLKHTSLSKHEIAEFFDGSLDVNKKLEELIQMRESVDRLIDVFSLETSEGTPRFSFTEETSFLCMCKTFPINGDIINRYCEARETYSAAVKSGYLCDFRHTFFYAYENLFPLSKPESGPLQSDKILPDCALKENCKTYRVCVPVVEPKNTMRLKEKAEVVTRKKSFVVQYAGEAYGAGAMYYLLQEEAAKRQIPLNGNVWSLSLTGPNKKNKKRTYTLIIGAEVE